MEALAQKVWTVLEPRTEVRLALLFGSAAKGTARPDSDVDLAVWGHGIDPTDLEVELSRALGCEVDVVDLDRASEALVEAVLRDGRFVFWRDPAARGEWLSRTLTALELDRPNFRRMNEAFLRRVATRGL